jgi:hypothetical protein
MFDAITLSTGDIDFLKLRTVGDSGDLRDKYVKITANLLNLEKSRCKMQLCKQYGIPARRISGGIRIRAKILKSESST